MQEKDSFWNSCLPAFLIGDLDLSQRDVGNGGKPHALTVSQPDELRFMAFNATGSIGSFFWACVSMLIYLNYISLPSNWT